MTPLDLHNSKPAAVVADAFSAGAVQRLLDRPVSAADLAAGARSAAAPAERRARGTVGVLLFRLNEEWFGLPSATLRRVTPLTRTVPIPHRTSGVLRGVCNIRGELVLCADLRRLLGLTPGPADKEKAGGADPRRMVGIGPAERPWVFEADELRGVERIDPSGLRPPPPTVGHALGAFVRGLADLDDGCITVLDAERALAGFEAGIA